jgi:hypothetical protein
MRYLFLAVLTNLLALSAVHAQYSKSFASGSYITTSIPRIQGQGKLLLETSQLLLVETPTGQELKFTPDQIAFFGLESNVSSLLMGHSM